ncbi:hypothetical protein Poli38472_003418 [Pythium oligandrum]|uniref:Amino acid transporter n=1 Tax=Pythium oligandrum TaxID=41045 RepID=A0A8K1FG62_PYTOL|nr:hypothetical protein Poli38472_003418 [Pythium oligandrum]|eukprot:TMW57493.1 hypothetical protein Poli38472_003418 [Pythium oligandrum]
MNYGNGQNPPGIILYDEPARRLHNSSSIDEALTPLDSISSPAIYYNDPIYLQKGPRGASKSVVGTPNRFMYQPEEIPMEYPDDGSSGRFAFLRRTTVQIIIGVVLGIGIGVLLSRLQASSDVSDLVNLPGKIFLRALKCFVIPMVFCSLSTGVANIVLLRKVSAVGTRTALYFVLSSLAATSLSLGVSLLLRKLHSDLQFEPRPPEVAFMHFLCPDGKYINIVNDSRLDCGATAMNTTTAFELIDLSNIILDNSPVQTVTVTEQVTKILQSIFPVNIFQSFQDGVLMSVIMFSIAFGAAAMQALPQQTSPLLELLNQMNKIFFFVISKLVDWSPVAVCSLIAGSLSSQKSLSKAVNHVGMLVLSNLVSALIFELIFYPIVLWLATRRNPFPFMKQMAPCVYFAFGSASSLATLPITLRCVESTREVSRALSSFVVTIGSTVHMEGTAMLFPNAIIFLVATSKTEIEIGPVQCVLIILVSLLASLGVAPIPNAGLLMVYSVWSTIFPDEELPLSYSYLVAIYWYLDRVNTVCNVVGDAYMARVIAEQVDEAFENSNNQGDDV